MLYKRRRERPRSLLTAISFANVMVLGYTIQIRAAQNRRPMICPGLPKTKLQQPLSGYLCEVKYVLYAILIYLAYQFIFKLVIPVYLASRKIKKQFREMNNRMEEQMRQQQGFASESHPSQPGNRVNPEDYIEFEEVK